jgi:hypothetical protein
MKDQIKKKLLQRCKYKLVNESSFFLPPSIYGYTSHDLKEIWVRPNTLIEISTLAHEIMHSRRPSVKKGVGKSELLALTYELHILWKYRLMEELELVLASHREILEIENFDLSFDPRRFHHIREAIKRLSKSNLWKRCEKLLGEEKGGPSHP